MSAGQNPVEENQKRLDEIKEPEIPATEKASEIGKQEAEALEKWLEIPKRLGEIKEPKIPATEAAFELEKQEDKAFKNSVDTDRQQVELAGLKQDIQERKDYASKTFKLICFWLVGVFALLLLQGFLGSNPSVLQFSNACKLTLKFNLDDSVLIAVVGGTTASVIGIFVYVVKYLFSKR